MNVFSCIVILVEASLNGSQLEHERNLAQAERLHRAIIQTFADSPDTRAAPLSLHAIVSLASDMVGKRPGDWFGPHTVAHLLAGAARRAEVGAGQGMLDNVCVYVAQDCTVYNGDA